jgi:hypothetical protein
LKNLHYSERFGKILYSGMSIRGLNQIQMLWQTYNAIREIEYTVRVCKTDLNLRPVFHKKDETSMAHLNFRTPDMVIGLYLETKNK